jgi:hypothetical protein
MPGISKYINLVNLLAKVYDGYSGHKSDCDVFQLRMDDKKPVCNCGYTALKK